MPSKKTQALNGFFYFMQTLRPQLQRQGVVLENGNKSLADIAGPKWAQLTAEERQPYNQIAKEQKAKKKMGLLQGGDDDKMDCTRQLISKRVDTVALNEQRRRRERKLVVESWTGKDICSECFYFVGFMSLCDLPENKFMPCEMAAVEFSLRDGIKREFHKFINPGTIPLGYRYDAVKQSEATHKIPIEGLSTETYQNVHEELLKFVNPRKLAAFPPLFCKSSDTKLIEFSLQWLATKAGSTNKLKKVYELEGLVCDLHAESTDAEIKCCPSKYQATELLSTTVFDYEVGARCAWHEENEVRHCARGTVKRYCYCLSDFLCAAFDIEMTSKHLPERPENSSCIVITPRSASNRKSQESQEKRDKENEAPYSAQDARSISNSYNENGVKRRQYARRGPTYDEESLRAGSEAIIPPPSNVPSIPSLGRGRGRGRAIPTQPLRRPNLPGVAASGGKVAAVDHKKNNEPTGTNDKNWLGSLGTGRGKGGLNRPSTTPKMWAGGPAAPHPSTAPLPPSSWHINTAVPSQSSQSQFYGNENPNLPTWASFGATNDYTMENYTYPRVNNPQYSSIESEENNVSNVQDQFQSFSLFDKDSYDY